MTLRKRHDTRAFLALTLVVVLIGIIAWPISSEFVLNTLTQLQISNNEQQAIRLAGLVEEELKKGITPEAVSSSFQHSLSLLPADDSGFVCMLGEQSEVLCHPNSNMIGRKMAGATRKNLEGETITYGESNEKNIPGGGIFTPDGKASEIVYQVPIKGQDWMMSVHSNKEIIAQKVDRIMNVLLLIAIPSAILLILVGTTAVRRTSAQYERKLEEANSQLEEKVKARTAELRRNYEELKQTREKLAQSEKMSFIGQLMAGITHEINNPLSSIIGNADLLLMKKKLDEKQTRAVSRIKIAGDRCSRLVRNLLTFSRNKPLERHLAPLNAVIDTVLEMLETETQRYGTTVNRHIPDDLPRLLVDRLQIEQVFLNLIKNAVEAMHDSPRQIIDIIAETHDDDVWVRVKDTGPGIPNDQLRFLFEAFFTMKEQGKGTGLGLSLCNRFVEAHGGTITVESKLGTGTEFLVKLPTT